MLMRVSQPSDAFHWSTNDVEPKHALAYWIETVGQSMLELDIDTLRRDTFKAALAQATFGPAHLSIVNASNQRLHRTRAAISRSVHPMYFLLQPRIGQLYMTQYGRRVHVQPKECVLADGMEPYEMHFPEDTRCLAIRLPQEWLKAWIPRPESVAALSFGADSGWGAALCAALLNLDVANCNSLGLSGSVICEQIASLLALATYSGSDPEPHRSTLFERMQRATRDRCNDDQLTPGALAEEFGISKRYLHHIFAQHNTTFGDELMRIRLERAHTILTDRRFASLEIGEVAARCGFVEPSHFARRFRQKFGVGPARFRASAIGLQVSARVHQ